MLHQNDLGLEVGHRTVITVLGARSGTSAMAGTLGRLGCALPQNMMVANWANVRGYFEPQDIADLHDEILASIGSTWSDWRPISREWFESVDAETYRDRLGSLFRANYGDSTLSVLKEPRMCRMLPLWHRVFDILRLEPAFCFVDRSPFDVAASLRTRDGTSLEHGIRYYIRNHLDAELATRGRRRVFVSYDSLLADWRKVVYKILERLSIALARETDREAGIDAFLDPGLCHQRVPTLELDRSSGLDSSSACDMAAAVHVAFETLASDATNQAALKTLDQVRDSFDTLPTHSRT